jgi:hypothetical protein
MANRQVSQIFGSQTLIGGGKIPIFWMEQPLLPSSVAVPGIGFNISPIVAQHLFQAF